MTVLFAVLGACAGSFAYAMTLRMADGRDWVAGRSECEKCHAVLKWYDLVPLLSWITSRGSCRHCHKPIGTIYPLVEVCSAAAFAVSAYFWPYGTGLYGYASFGLWCVFMTLMISLVIFDLKWFLLPDKIVYTMVVLAGGAQIFFVSYFAQPERLTGIVLGVVVGSGIFYVLHKASNGRYIGDGDYKYGIFFGLLLGSGFKSMLVISLGSLIGTVLVLPALLLKKRGLSSQIPFGPSLIAATYVVYIFGDRLIERFATLYLFP